MQCGVVRMQIMLQQKPGSTPSPLRLVPRQPELSTRCTPVEKPPIDGDLAPQPALPLPVPQGVIEHVELVVAGLCDRRGTGDVEVARRAFYVNWSAHLQRR